MIGAQYRAAIINGQKIVLGKKYEQATLIKVTENEAVLRSPDGTTQTLSMGKVDKKMSAPDAPTKTIPAKNTNVKQASKTRSPDQSK
jgi:MSHA biogenesis protein MshK